MKICLVAVGKVTAAYLQAGIEEYEKRLQHYIPYETRVIPAVKHAGSLPRQALKEREGDAILEQLEAPDAVVLLDERGTTYSSLEFSIFISRRMQEGTRRLVFIAGGAYGVAGKVLDCARDRVSLSRMTFSHQLARLVFVEQLYRAMTIWKGEQYHHE